MTLPLLAFTPLIDPLSALYPILSDYWLAFVLPLVLVISIVYKCTRIKELKHLPWQATTMTLQIILLMGVAAVALDGLYWIWLRTM